MPAPAKPRDRCAALVSMISPRSNSVPTVIISALAGMRFILSFMTQPHRMAELWQRVFWHECRMHRHCAYLAWIVHSGGRVGMDYFFGGGEKFHAEIHAKSTSILVSAECYLTDLCFCASPHHDLTLR